MALALPHVHGDHVPTLPSYPQSPQSAGGRFRNQNPMRPAPATDRNVMWDLLFNKPKHTVPPAFIPVRPLQRDELDAAPDRSTKRDVAN